MDRHTLEVTIDKSDLMGFPPPPLSRDQVNIMINLEESLYSLNYDVDLLEKLCGFYTVKC